ncbi:MAG: phosphoglycerate mutase family protein [Planctomycetota bacterium]
MKQLFFVLVLAVASGLVVTSFALQGEGESMPADELPVRTVFLVRHAETTDGSGDRALSDAGVRRAVSLARLLSTAGITRVYSSHAKRAKQTVEPLAKALGVRIETLDARTIEDWTAAVAALPPGAAAIFCGHSNTTPALARALGAEELPEVVPNSRYGPVFDEDAYDRLLIVTLPPHSLDGNVLELRYGAGPPAEIVLEGYRPR